MGKIRTNIKGQYKLEKHELYTAVHYALRYEELKKEYKNLTDTSKGMRYDFDKVQTTIDSDPTYVLAERRSRVGGKISNIESAARAAAGEVLYPYILKAVTQEGVKYELMKYEYKMPAGKNLFYLLKRKFYYILAQKI
ncbi:MAG: hypothetical protein K5894_08365 [Lachnospiraceae bacterium]|nr:hypothetical protein [Lachnospiraceae bacterium]